MNAQTLDLLEKEGAPHACAHASHIDEFVLDVTFALVGNITLQEILARAKLSKSTAYKYGIVPMYDQKGMLIKSINEVPFPWICLPEPIVKKGKKLWHAVDIMEWFRCIRDRACQSTHDSVSSNQMRREVAV